VNLSTGELGLSHLSLLPSSTGVEPAQVTNCYIYGSSGRILVETPRPSRVTCSGLCVLDHPVPSLIAIPTYIPPREDEWHHKVPDASLHEIFGPDRAALVHFPKNETSASWWSRGLWTLFRCRA